MVKMPFLQLPSGQRYTELDVMCLSSNSLVFHSSTNFYASANVLHHVYYYSWVCEFVRASRTLLAQYQKVLDMFSVSFQHWHILWQGWTHQIWGQKVKVPTIHLAGKCTFFLVNTMSWKLLYWICQTFNFDTFWSEGKCFSFWGRRSKVKVTAWPRTSSRCIQSSMLCIEF